MGRAHRGGAARRPGAAGRVDGGALVSTRRNGEKSALLDQVRAMIRATPVNGFIGCAAALADHDFRSGVGATKPPVLFVAGEKDAGGAVPAAMKSLYQALPGSHYVELAGAGHISNLDDPTGFNRAVREFLSA